MRYRLKVLRIHTLWIPTQVVYFKTVRNTAYG